MNFASLMTMIVVVLVLQIGMALHVRGMVGGVIFIQACYGLIGWVFRPLVLVWVDPVPQTNDALADFRLSTTGYASFYEQALPYVLVGLSVSLVLYAVASIGLRRSSRASPIVGCLDQRGIVLLITVGWIFRIVGLIAQTAGLAVPGALAAVGVAFLVFAGRFQDRRHAQLVLSLALASEALWSVATASKTPFIAACLWLLLRYFAAKTISWKQVSAIALMVVVAFTVLQQVKVARGDGDSLETVDRSYPVLIQPVLPILRRFDMSSALTDAYLAGSGAWIGVPEAASTFFRSLVPEQLIGEKEDNVGARWASEVRSQSTGSATSNVHLANGPIAEGYLLDGVVGVVIESALLSGATIIAALLCTRRGTFSGISGVAILSGPGLFEGSGLALGEALGRALQIAAIGFVLITLSKMLSGETVEWKNTGRLPSTTAQKSAGLN